MEKSIPKPVDVHVGKRVRLRRVLLGLTQAKVANALGLTFQQVQKYESGANRIGSSRLYQISQILNVPIAFFFDEMPDEISGSPISEPHGFDNSLETDKMERKETLNLVKNYYGIEDEAVRKNLYNLVKSMV